MRYFAALATFGTLAAQNPDIDSIVKRSLDREMRNVRALDDYTYEISEKTITYDRSGKPRKTEAQVEEILQIDGTRYRKLVAENGKPLNAERARKEQAKLDKELTRRKNESDGARQKRIRDEQKQRQEMRQVREDVAKAFTFTYVGAETIGGAPCWRVHAEPKAGVTLKTDMGRRVLPKMRGDIWIAQGTYEWLRVEADTLETIRFGGFLASLAKGSTFRMEQALVAPNLWHPRRMEARINARALVMNFNVGQEIEFRNFRKFSAESKLLAADELADTPQNPK